MSAEAQRERDRQAAYLYSIIQSAEESEGGGPDGDVQQAFDEGILYAAKAVLQNWAGSTEWPVYVTEYAEEIAARVVPGSGLPSRWEKVVKAATAWRERITDHPNAWADAEDFALIASVDALEDDDQQPRTVQDGAT